MEYKKENLETYNLHTIKLDSFKESRIEVTFRENITREDFLKCVFLADLLCYSTKNYPRKKDMIIKSEELYQTVISGNTSRLGKSLVLTIGCNFINPEYTKEDDYLEEVIKYFTDAIFNPNIKDNQFDKETFEIIRNEWISNYETKNESPMRVASYNAFNLLEAESKTRIFLDNFTKEEFLDLTPSDIYEFYKKVLEHFICDIFVVGNLDFEKVNKLLSKHIKLKTIKNHNIELYEENAIRKKALAKTDSSTFNQSTILMAYNLVELSEEEKLYSIHLFDYIFCNGSFKSKLFKSLREDNSLCYGVSSFYMKFDKMYGLKVSLAKENVKKALKLMDKALKEMTEGNFDDEIIDEARKSILNSLKTASDVIYSFSNDAFLKEIDNFPQVEERVKGYRKVTKEDIINISKKLRKNLIYVLESGEESARN